MNRSPLGELARIASRLVPTATSIFFVLLGAVPLGLPGFATVGPLFSLCALFFWTVVRPTLLPPVAVFFIGLFEDALSGGPLGLWAVIFLLVQFMTISQRRILVGIRFLLSWASFVPVCYIAGVAAWGGASLYYGHILSVKPIMVQSTLTLLAYPAVAWLLTLCTRKIMSSG